MTLRQLQRALANEFCPPFISGVSATMTKSGDLVVKYKGHQVVFNHRKRWTMESLADQLRELKGCRANYTGLSVKIGARDADFDDQGNTLGAGTCL